MDGDVRESAMADCLWRASASGWRVGTETRRWSLRKWLSEELKMDGSWIFVLSSSREDVGCLGLSVDAGECWCGPEWACHCGTAGRCAGERTGDWDELSGLCGAALLIESEGEAEEDMAGLI